MAALFARPAHIVFEQSIHLGVQLVALNHQVFRGAVRTAESCLPARP